MTTSIASLSIDQLSIDTLRLLAVDSVEKAKSGYPRGRRWAAHRLRTCCFTS